MSKYKYTDKCDEISGFGGTYEESCRKMVISGVEWFDDNKNSDPQFHGFKNVYGLIIEDNDDAKKLTNYMNESINKESTGAMMQACLEHVKYVYQHGWDNYIKEMEKININKV